MDDYSYFDTDYYDEVFSEFYEYNEEEGLGDLQEWYDNYEDEDPEPDDTDYFPLRYA